MKAQVKLYEIMYRMMSMVETADTTTRIGTDSLQVRDSLLRAGLRQRSPASVSRNAGDLLYSSPVTGNAPARSIREADLLHTADASGTADRLMVTAIPKSEGKTTDFIFIASREAEAGEVQVPADRYTPASFRAEGARNQATADLYVVAPIGQKTADPHTVSQ